MAVVDRKPEVIDLTEALRPLDLTELFTAREPAIDLTDVLSSPREYKQSPRPFKRDTPSQFWHKPVAKGESHIDLESIERTSRNAQDKLAAVLRGGARTKIIRAVAKQAIEQARAGKLPAQWTFAHDPELEAIVLQHAQAVFDAARQQTKAEIDRQLAARRSHA
jgi:hypothetical protein